MHARNTRTPHQTHGFALVSFVLLAALLAGCGGLRGPAPAATSGSQATTDPLAITQAAETIIADLTRNAPPTAAQQAAPTNTPTEEPLPPTSTPLPTDTPLPSDTPLPTNTPLPSDTPTPVQSPTATTPPEPAWQLGFYDDFSSTRSWLDDTGGLWRTNYTAGGYSITNRAVNDIIFSTRTDQYSGVRLEVKAQRVSGPVDAYYGVICNFINGGNFYMLGVGTDGSYSIVKKQSSKITVLAEGIDTSGAMQAGGGVMTIRGDCYNGQLVLWVNGFPLASVRDLAFMAGSIGLGVGSRNVGNVEVLFDDFYLYTIAPAATPAVATAQTP